MSSSRPARREGIDVEAQWGAYEARIPLRRLAHADDVARAPSSSPPTSASYVNGAQIVVDGGLLALTRCPSLPRVHPRAADGRQPARVAARLDAALDRRSRCSTRSPTASTSPSTPTARSGASCSRARRVHDRRRDAHLCARRHVLRSDGSPHSAVISPGFVGIDVFADADRYRPRAKTSSAGEVAGIDGNGHAGHQRREVARAEERNPGDVVRGRDAAEWQARPERVELEPGRLELCAPSLEPGVVVTVGAIAEHADAARPELDGQALRQAANAVLRRDVVGGALPRRRGSAAVEAMFTITPPRPARSSRALPPAPRGTYRAG